RSGGARPGQDTSPIEFPWIVQLLYASDGNRQCAGSLISDRHVLTARRCVDRSGPNERSDAVLEAKDISVLYGTRHKYGGMMNVKAVRTYDAKLKKGAAADLAVLELEKAVEFSDVARPICLANEFDENTQHTVFGLHFGEKKRPDDEEVTRHLYFDVLFAANRKNCEESLGHRFHKDEFCVSKRNKVFIEGIHTGAPIMTPNNDGGRWVQVGISLEASKENNYGSATRIDLYDEVIQELTHCYINEANDTFHNDSKKDDTFHDNYDNDTFHEDYKNDYDAYYDDYDQDDYNTVYNRATGTVETGPRRKEIPVEVGPVDNWVWILNVDPRDRSDLSQPGYVHCYALNRIDGEVEELVCEEEHAVVCEVSAMDGICDKDGEVYYKDEKDDAYCYKIVYESIDEPVREIDEGDIVHACKSADAGEPGFVHSPQENHLVAIMFRGKYEADNRYVCLRLGVFFDESDGEISLRQVVDGSAFDFGAQPNGTVPKCGSDPGYPWCNGEPNCQGDETSLVHMAYLNDGETQLGRDCWDDSEPKSCSVVCKRKLN
ncbi:proteaseserine29 precursor, partial [Aphelenchoides avenae]